MQVNAELIEIALKNGLLDEPRSQRSRLFRVAAKHSPLKLVFAFEHLLVAKGLVARELTLSFVPDAEQRHLWTLAEVWEYERKAPPTKHALSANL